MTEQASHLIFGEFLRLLDYAAKLGTGYYFAFKKVDDVIVIKFCNLDNEINEKLVNIKYFINPDDNSIESISKYFKQHIEELYNAKKNDERKVARQILSWYSKNSSDEEIDTFIAHMRNFLKDV